MEVPSSTEALPRAWSRAASWAERHFVQEEHSPENKDVKCRRVASGSRRGGARVWCDCDPNLDLRVGVLGHSFPILSVGRSVTYLCWHPRVVASALLVHNDATRKQCDRVRADGDRSDPCMPSARLAIPSCQRRRRRGVQRAPSVSVPVSLFISGIGAFLGSPNA